MRGIGLFIGLLVALTSVAQKKGTFLHPSILELHFSYNNFQNKSLYEKPKLMDPGIGLFYLKGINSQLDWMIRTNGSFPSNASKTILSDKVFLLKTDFSLRARLFSRSNWVQPYLTAGTGMALYNNKAVPYAVPGAGIQFNHKDIYFLINTNYVLPFNDNLQKHFMHSVGIAGVLAKPKKSSIVRAAIEPSANIIKDRDGDGIVDSLDVCPDKPGIIKFNGCPDSDGDGIQDKEDGCPLLFGLLKYRGCPVPDTDKDGINDEEDRCINIPSVLRYQGCPVPDSDKDGINDEQDSCIQVPGLRENNGCPVVKKELNDEMRNAAKNVFFETGSYKLLPVSFKSLDKVAEILKNNPDLFLLIEGHTDNQGAEAMNQVLSENRAVAVAHYLISKGIDKKRLKSMGYGQSKPIDDNNTSQGRARNRRVDLRLFLRSYNPN